MENEGTIVKKEQPDGSSDKYEKIIAGHKAAANHLVDAAMHHLDAAKFHEEGNHEKAFGSAVKANALHEKVGYALIGDTKLNSMSTLQMNGNGGSDMNSVIE